MGRKKSLTDNLGVKLIALVVAFAIWFNASGQKEVTWLRTIPVSLQNVPDSLIVINRAPGQVEISITGTKRQLMLMGFKRLRCVVDLSESVPGGQRISLTPRQIQLPSGIDRRNVRVIEPMSIDLRLERLVSRRAQVTLSTTGAIPENLILMDGAVSITPSWVWVRGPASTVQHIRTVTTEPLDFAKIKDSFERELLVTADAGISVCDPERVTVSVRVSERGERVLANVPPTVLVDSEDWKTTVIPSSISLTLSGPRSILDTLSSGDVSVLLNLGGLGEASYRMAPEVILPPGVDLTSMSVDSLTVEIVADRGADSP